MKRWIFFLKQKKPYSQNWKFRLFHQRNWNFRLLHERRTLFTEIHWVPIIIVCLWLKKCYTQDYYYKSKSSYLLLTQKINFLITKSAEKHTKNIWYHLLCIPFNVEGKRQVFKTYIFILLFEITESKTWFWFSFTLSLYCTML